MHSKTRGSKKEPCKHIPTNKKRELEELHKTTVPQRVIVVEPPKKRSRVEEPIPISSESSPSPATDTADTDDAPKGDLTMNTSVILSSTSVYVDSFLVQLGAFDFRKFFADNASRVTKSADKAKVGFQWDKGETTISAKGIAKNQWLHPEIEDEEGWANVEGMVKRWMKSPKTGDINVNMILHFKKTQLGTDGLEFEDEELTIGKKV